MELFSASKIIFLSIGTYAILFTSRVCSDESTVNNLESQEINDDLLESIEDTKNQRNVNSEELQYWTSNILNDIGLPIMNKYSNLPIQLERAFLEERDIKPAVNLPLRFGRALEDRIAKSVPNLPQRFGRYLSARANTQSLANLPQRFGRSFHGGRFVQSHVTLPQRFGRTTSLQRLQYEMNPYLLEVKTPDEGNDRFQNLNYDYERKVQK